ncbi:unnamed protein product [Bathycoccus prasinos]
MAACVPVQYQSAFHGSLSGNPIGLERRKKNNNNESRRIRRRGETFIKPVVAVAASRVVSSSSSSFELRERATFAFTTSTHQSAVSAAADAVVGRRRGGGRMKRKTEAFVDPWGVTDAEYTTLEANLFAASLFPPRFPKRALFGFKFLLVFVFATIPAGIYAKVHYSDILANVDWLHGGAESLLTITNLLIVLGMREGLRDAEREAKEKREKDLTTTATTTLRSVDSVVVNSENSTGKSMGDARSENDDGGSTDNRININSTFSLAGLTLLVVDAVAATTDSIADVADGSVVSSLIASAKHGEPGNALSLPTWVIHASSLIEWLVAMSLIWNYADVKKRPSYKGLTWGMVTSHASGLAACTFHVFYNSPALNSVVALQAGLTCIGNATMGIAAYRMYQEGKRLGISSDDADDADAVSVLAGTKALQTPSAGTSFLETDDAFLLLKLALVSTLVSALVKWGSLFVDFPFEPSVLLAYSMIVFPTILNMNAWKKLSDDPTKKADSLL